MANVNGCPSFEMTVEGVTSFCNESSCADDNPEVVSEAIAKRNRPWVHAPIEKRRHSPVCRPLSLPHAWFILLQELDRWDCQGPLRPHSRVLEEVANEAVCGACEYCDYDFDLAFRTFAQRCRWASAIRSRASLLRIRLPLLLPFA